MHNFPEGSVFPEWLPEPLAGQSCSGAEQGGRLHCLPCAVCVTCSHKHHRDISHLPGTDAPHLCPVCRAEEPFWGCILACNKTKQAWVLPQVWTGFSHIICIFQLNWLFHIEPSLAAALVSNEKVVFFFLVNIFKIVFLKVFSFFASLHSLSKGYVIATDIF